MEEERYDVAILGGGPGGYVAAIRAAQLGLKTALVEKDKVGGTCLHRGCIPTKVLLESAEVLALARRGKEFGVRAENPTIDYAQVRQRQERIVRRLHQGVEYLLRQNGVAVLRGEGRLLGPTAVAVAEPGGRVRQAEARDLVIATGSYAKSLPGLAIDGQRIISSDHALALNHIPRSLVIVGAGAVGVEFASLYHDFGAEVTLVEMLPTLVPLEDREIGEALARAFTRRGIKVLTGAKVLPESIRTADDSVTVEVSRNGQTERVSGEKLLVAVGRGANIEGIGLEALGVKIERGFIQVDRNMRTGESHLYAIGDATGGLLLAHKASAEGILAVEAIAGQAEEGLDYNRLPRCTYCRPQIASLGLSEEEAVAQGYRIKIGRFPFQANARALILGEGEGFAKIIAEEASGEILGVHIIGPHATELIAEAALGKLLEATPLEIGMSVHAHPTLAEVVGEAAHDTEGRAIHIWRAT